MPSVRDPMWIREPTAKLSSGSAKMRRNFAMRIRRVPSISKLGAAADEISRTAAVGSDIDEQGLLQGSAGIRYPYERKLLKTLKVRGLFPQSVNSNSSLRERCLE
jgi:hypothetical protein